MIDWRKIDGFEWDAGNERRSADKHGVSKAEAEQVFFNTPMLLLADEKHSAAEMRVHALGQTDGRRLLQVTFTLRQDDTKIRVISARQMKRNERALYEQDS